MTETTAYFTFHGHVQYAMFRQTIMRLSINRNVTAGATNCTDDKNKVIATFQGDRSKIDEIISILSSGKILNSWNAKVTSFEENETGQSIESHEVTTKNVDDIQWPGEVELYVH